MIRCLTLPLNGVWAVKCPLNVKLSLPCHLKQKKLLCRMWWVTASPRWRSGSNKQSSHWSFDLRGFKQVEGLYLLWAEAPNLHLRHTGYLKRNQPYCVSCDEDRRSSHDINVPSLNVCNCTETRVLTFIYSLKLSDKFWVSSASDVSPLPVFINNIRTSCGTKTTWSGSGRDQTSALCSEPTERRTE